MLDQHAQFIRGGGAIVVLKHRDKRPVDNDWTQLPPLTWEEARERYSIAPLPNIGVRLGAPSCVKIDGEKYYVHGLDLDVRKPKRTVEAQAALASLVGDTEGLACVRSGSGGASRHFYFLCKEHLRSKVLLHSEDKFVDEGGHKHYFWEIELGGTGKQFVLPPSIHPVTRKPYEWIEEVPWDELRVILASKVRGWIDAAGGGHEHGKPMAEVDDDLDDLTALCHKLAAQAKKNPRYSLGEVELVLERLSNTPRGFADNVEDRDGWRDVGFAIHNWSKGSDDGFEMWCAYSARSDKFDEADSRRVWRSMDKGGASAVALTMRTLQHRGDANQAAAMLGMDERYAEARAATEAAIEDDFGVRSNRQSQEAQRRERDALDGNEAPAGIEHVYKPEPDAPPPMSVFDIGHLLHEIDNEHKRDRHHAETAWELELKRSDSDTVLSCPHNYNTIVRAEPLLKGIIALNEFTHEVVFKKEFTRITSTMTRIPLLDPINGDIWQDKHETMLAAYLQTPVKGKNGGWGMNPSQHHLSKAVDLASESNPFHPVRDWLASLRWDGGSRVDTLFVRFLGCEDTTYAREVATIYCIAAVARIFTPGVKFDFVPVLEGGEGIGKSTFVRILCHNEDWFGELFPNFRDPSRMIEGMKGNWQMEWPELSGLQRADAEAAKAFVSRQEDQIRLAYARRAATFPRHCVFIGTTNEPTYLTSENGNRRWLPIAVGVEMINFETLRAEVPQIWAEAVALYKKWVKTFREKRLPLYLRDPASIEYAKALQQSRKRESAADVVNSDIWTYVETPGSLSDMTGDRSDQFKNHGELFVRTRIDAGEAWKRVMGQDRPMTHGDMITIGIALSKLGWMRRKARFGGAPRSFHVRPGASKRDIALGYMPATR